DPHVVGQRAQAVERVPELLRRALEHLAATQGEDGVAAEQRALLPEGIGDMTGSMAGNEENLGLGLAEAVAVAVLDRHVDARNACLVTSEADDGAAGRLLDLAVTAHVTPIMMGVEDLRELPASLVALGQDGPGARRIAHANRTTLRLA